LIECRGSCIKRRNGKKEGDVKLHSLGFWREVRIFETVRNGSRR